MKSKSVVLDRLIEIIRKNKSKSPDLSYTSKLFNKGKVKIANKVGEEATETITAFFIILCYNHLQSLQYHLHQNMIQFELQSILIYCLNH